MESNATNEVDSILKILCLEPYIPNFKEQVCISYTITNNILIPVFYFSKYLMEGYLISIISGNIWYWCVFEFGRSRLTRDRNTQQQFKSCCNVSHNGSISAEEIICCSANLFYNIWEYSIRLHCNLLWYSKQSSWPPIHKKDCQWNLIVNHNVL